MTAFRLAGSVGYRELRDEVTEIVMKESAIEEPMGPPDTVIPATGYEAIRRLHSGTRVVRGPDWKWGDQVCVRELIISLITVTLLSLI